MGRTGSVIVREVPWDCEGDVQHHYGGDSSAQHCLGACTGEQHCCRKQDEHGVCNVDAELPIDWQCDRLRMDTSSANQHSRNTSCQKCDD
ncbi:MAG: hypothetical protein JW395_2318 [Nitrospira sp.]|nr:hypothetical protein [Nitrospira sp.]